MAMRVKYNLHGLGPEQSHRLLGFFFSPITICLFLSFDIATSILFTGKSYSITRRIWVAMICFWNVLFYKYVALDFDL